MLLTGRVATDVDSWPWVTSGRATATPDCAWAGRAHAGEQPHWGHVAAAPVANGTSRYHDWGPGPPRCRPAASHAAGDDPDPAAPFGTSSAELPYDATCASLSPSSLPFLCQASSTAEQLATTAITADGHHRTTSTSSLTNQITW